MAGLKFRAVTGQVALVAATAKTVMQLIAAAHHRVKVHKLIVSFEGVSATDAPVQVRVLRQTTAGTMSALTPVKDNDSDDETLQTTAQHTATAEPTAGDVLETHLVHPQTARAILGPFWIKGGGRLGIECNAPNAVDVVVAAECEE